MSAKRLSPAAINALKEALVNIYWYKNDLRSFLSNCVVNSTLIGLLNWGNYKRQIVTDLIDELTRDQETHLGALTKLCYEVINLNTFTHLEQLDDGLKKARKAREAVAQLKQLIEPHQEKVKDDENTEQRRKESAERLKKNKALREKFSDLNNQYINIATGSNPQARGFELESFMYDLFELFDLDPKSSFKNTGEQIDGAFTLEGTDYLFEAKWHQKKVGGQSLGSFSSKVQGKLDNTLGLFLSINGFSSDGVKAHSTARPSIILMDGADLMAVLEERIDFVTLLLRKKRHAAQTGNIYLHIHEINALL